MAISSMTHLVLLITLLGILSMFHLAVCNSNNETQASGIDQKQDSKSLGYEANGSGDTGKSTQSSKEIEVSKGEISSKIANESSETTLNFRTTPNPISSTFTTTNDDADTDSYIGPHFHQRTVRHPPTDYENNTDNQSTITSETNSTSTRIPTEPRTVTTATSLSSTAKTLAPVTPPKPYAVKNLRYRLLNESSPLKDFFKDGNVIVNLRPCSNYIMVGDIEDEVGTVLNNFTTNFSTSYDDPSGVVDIQLKNKSSTSVVVHWKQPKSNKECVKNYTLKWSQNKSKSIDNASETETEIKNLKPCENYNLTISANGNRNITSNLTFRLAPNLPEKIKNLTVISNVSKTVNLYWDSPPDNPQCGRKYEVDCGNEVKTVKHTSVKCENFVPCREYNFSVSVLYDDEGQKGKSEAVFGKHKVMEDPPERVEIKDSAIEITNHSLTLEGEVPNAESECVLTARFVCELNKNNDYDSPPQKSVYSSNKFIDFKEGKITFTGKVTGLDPYSEYDCFLEVKTETAVKSTSEKRTFKTDEGIASRPKNVAIKTVTSTSFVISWKQPDNPRGIINYYKVIISSGNYENTFNVSDGSFEKKIFDLQYSTMYTIKITAVNKAGEGDYETRNTTTGSIDLFYLYIMILVILIITIILLLIAIIKPGALTKMKQDTLNLFIRKTEEPKDVPENKFIVYYRKASQNKFEMLTTEYETLNSYGDNLINGQRTHNVAKLAINKYKNRYVNILPYDANRVILEIDESDYDDELYNNDYINASYIKGYLYKREYIASQGPTPDTCSDFWRMVIQCNCEGIVMLTQLVESNKIKCHEYYPRLSEKKDFMGLIVECLEEVDTPTFIKRTLHVKWRNQKKTVIQYHYGKWPDHGCPATPNDLIEFVRFVRSQRKYPRIPMVVHCSAGVGRTGTFIALDILIQRLTLEKKINIYSTMKELREQRVKMVQTLGQYNFLYGCCERLVRNHKAEIAKQRYHGISIPEVITIEKTKEEEDNGALIPIVEETTSL